MKSEDPDQAQFAWEADRDVEELLTEISIRSADQHLSSIAREVVDRLRRGEFDAVDLSRTSDDRQSTLVVGIRWNVDGTGDEGRSPHSPAWRRDQDPRHAPET